MNMIAAPEQGLTGIVLTDSAARKVQELIL